MTNSDPLNIWAISDGRRGMENQALGLAEAIARQRPAVITTKRIAIQWPFDQLPGRLWPSPLNRLSKDSDPLGPPLPDIWIACGRRTIPLSGAVHGKGPLVIQTQDPRAPLDQFDLVVPPLHDQVSGPNVYPILGSPNRLTVEGLAQAAHALAPLLPPLPQPYGAVLLGGDSKDYQLTDAVLDQVISVLQSAHAAGYGLVISPSRRTPASAIDRLNAALDPARSFIWDGKPIAAVENPYLGMLGLASRLWVTEESANMLTDAAFTGKPVHLLPMEGGAPKWQRFHASLADRQVINAGADLSADWSYEPVRETDRVARHALDLLESRRG
ncbi:mitochondrial fission ELM1 family protein [Parvularcula sp. LCG005]|uniref:mitochondrial fission ELM1 family protein n=1 Tax=Parvularcula sp. LCG005 TaxID=3078805 RepID=UPI002941FF90|nr:mitochondrial fission ELM1 family protein [Parvularcula sp. LCG005]WOI52364.1 mitochondrial fission ELM1 family protein [Parvularcula sp. LCG005]